MWIGIFYALLINGQNWIRRIIQSFGILGQRAAGVNGTITPSNVLSVGLNIFGALLSGASNAGFLTKRTALYQWIQDLRMVIADPLVHRRSIDRVYSMIIGPKRTQIVFRGSL